MTIRRAATVTQTPIPGGWEERSVTCAGRTWNLLLPADADRFLDQLETLPPAAPEPDVYWARLWPAALPFAELLPQAPWPAGASLLELGCGIGLAGLVALAAGWQVTFSDYEPLAVEVALANAEAHGFQEASGLVFDWNQPPPHSYAGIIGSEILYDRHQHAAILQLVAATLAPEGVAWFGDPGRYHTAAFADRARKAGFDVTIRDELGAIRAGIVPGTFQVLELRRTLACPAATSRS